MIFGSKYEKIFVYWAKDSKLFAKRSKGLKTELTNNNIKRERLKRKDMWF